MSVNDMAKSSSWWSSPEFLAYMEDQWPHRQLDSKPTIKEQKGVEDVEKCRRYKYFDCYSRINVATHVQK